MKTKSFWRNHVKQGSVLVACFIIFSFFCGTQKAMSDSPPAGTVWEWQYGWWWWELGGQSTPKSVSDMSDVVTIASSVGHYLAIKRDGTVWAWGNNEFGQVGSGNNIISDVMSIAAGAHHSLALKRDGTVWAWGRNAYGQLGTVTYDWNVPTPVPVSDLTDVMSIAAGYYHSLALKRDGTVWAWGNNWWGELGNGVMTAGIYNPPRNDTPIQVNGLTDVVVIGSGAHHSLALKRDGTVWAWGFGVGTFGPAATTPIQVSGITDVVAITGGHAHTIAIKRDGTVWAWGNNGEGQPGNGTWDNSNTPVQVSGLTDVVGIACGHISFSPYCLALKNTGTVWGWGFHIGSIPVRVVGIKGAIGIAAGYDSGNRPYSLAIVSEIPPRDATPPSTATIVNGIQGQDAWYVSEVNITLIATDDDSGVEDVHYRIDGGTEDVIPEDTAYVTVTGDGMHTLSFYAVDKTGNVEDLKALTVKIDATPPTITVNSPLKVDYLISDTLTIDFVVTDFTSGAASLTATLDGVDVTNGQTINLYKLSPGVHTLSLNAEDAAGNISTKTLAFNVVVTAESLVEIIRLFYNMGFIDNWGIAGGLIKQIENNAISAFFNFVDAQDGRHISGYAADVLRMAAKSL